MLFTYLPLFFHRFILSVMQAQCLRTYSLIKIPPVRLPAHRSHKETVSVMRLYKEPHVDGCSNPHDRVPGGGGVRHALQ